MTKTEQTYTRELLERQTLESKFMVRHSAAIINALKYCMNKDDKCQMVDLIAQAIPLYYGEIEPKLSTQSMPLYFQLRDDIFRQINGFLSGNRMLSTSAN